MGVATSVQSGRRTEYMPLSVEQYQRMVEAVILGIDEDSAERLPGADDVTCVIEVADSSLERDEGRKPQVYASAGSGNT